MISGEIKHTKKPDCDNLLKHLDYLNGTAFIDDAQSFGLHARKFYSENPRTEITIYCYEEE